MHIRGALNPPWCSLPGITEGKLRPRVAASLTSPRLLLFHQRVMGDSEFAEDEGKGPHSGCRVTPKAERTGPST